MSSLILQNVSYQYEGSQKAIFKDANMHFEMGNVYGILGKSGAGKSTLLALLAGLDIATTGSIIYDGENLAEINRDHYRARKVGIIFQSFNLLTNATAIDNILLSMNISGMKDRDQQAQAYALLAKVGIDRDKAQRLVLKLSGGEQQRVSLARALAHKPKLIIADEPTGNLDKETEKSILNIFSQLAHEEKICVVIVTHSKQAASIADVVWSIDKGTFRQLPVTKH